MDSLNSLPSDIGHRFLPVKHRREFQHQSRRPGRQFGHQFQHIGCTVGNTVGTRPMGIAAGRVDEDEVGRIHRAQIVGGIGANHLGMSETQGREILR